MPVHDFVTVQEAADTIGITHSRVCQMIRAGELKAERLGDRIWLISCREVSRVKKSKRRGGRPRVSDR